MPKHQTLLDTRDIKDAITFWVDAGCPVQPSSSRVALSFSPGGHDPRELEEYSAVVGPKPNPSQGKD